MHQNRFRVGSLQSSLDPLASKGREEEARGGKGLEGRGGLPSCVGMGPPNGYPALTEGIMVKSAVDDHPAKRPSFALWLDLPLLLETRVSCISEQQLLYCYCSARARVLL